MSEPAIIVRGLHKSYRLDKVSLHVLRGVSLTVEAGEFLGVVGASGIGKSTLLHLVGLLDEPDAGEIVLHGVNAATLSHRRRDRIRCRDVGFVFQFYHLLPELSVLENVLLPAQVDSSILGWPSRRSALRRRACEVLDRMGLAPRLKHRPKELSGGERQRVAIARALMNGPKILLADEPTGNLDSKTGGQILDLLRQFHLQQGQTLIMVTHDPELTKQADRVLHIRDGRIAEK
jgi:lipoprotein-releasing system ATP-binding protein